MTCFWTGILQNLNKEDYQLIGIKPIKDVKIFINQLKNLAKDNEFNITWQNQDISENEIKYLRLHIKDYDINKIKEGHLTSSFDPFLCLLADVLKVKIEFQFVKSKIIFQSKDKVRRVLRFRGSRSHFSKG